MDDSWISVDERLPEIDMDRPFGCSKYVLTRDNFGDIISAWYQFECPYQKSREAFNDGYAVGWHGAHYISENSPIAGVTHWIEMDALPEIPEAKCEQ